MKPDTRKPITPELRAFLAELADLLEKHEVTIAATENSYAYSVSVGGIEFDQNGKFNAEEDRYERLDSFARFYNGTSSIDADWLRQLTAEHP